jgi:hypothetical protein
MVIVWYSSILSLLGPIHQLMQTLQFLFSAFHCAFTLIQFPVHLFAIKRNPGGYAEGCRHRGRCPIFQKPSVHTECHQHRRRFAWSWPLLASQTIQKEPLCGASHSRSVGWVNRVPGVIAAAVFAGIDRIPRFFVLFLSLLAFLVMCDELF